jgi:ribosomal protein L16/L10AE
MVLFEVAGADEAIVREAFRKAARKLSVGIKIIARE